MSEMVYHKGVLSELDEEFAQSQPFGRIRVGQKHLFWKQTLRWYFLTIDQVERLYRRIEEVNGKTGCCSNDFSIHRLMVVKKGGEVLSLLIGDSLYRHEPERLMDAISQRFPHLAFGKKE